MARALGLVRRLCYNRPMKTGNLKYPILMVAIVALMAGSFAAGRFLAPPSPAEAPAQRSVAPAPRVAEETLHADALALSKALSEVDALKAERTVLREELAALRKADEIPAEPTPPANRSRRQSWKERMEEMKKNDPERYKAEMERRERFTQAIAQAREARDSFLGDVDLSLFSDEQRKTHTQFVEALARQTALEEQMRALWESGEQPSEEQHKAMRETFDAVRSLRAAERSALLGAMATSMGLSQSESADFVQLVSDVYEATGGLRPRMGGGPGGPGGR